MPHFARSYDRPHTLGTAPRGVDYELRETFESGLLFGRKTLEALGVKAIEAIGIMDDIAAATRQGWCSRKRSITAGATCCIQGPSGRNRW